MSQARVLLAVSAFAIAAVISAPSAGQPAGVARMRAAAAALLESLDPEQRAAALFALEGEARTNWSNTPPYVHARPGVRVGSLDVDQRTALHDLLRASLSSQGYQKVAGVMRLDDVHRERELERLADDAPAYTRAVSASFGTANYAFAVFGDPRTDDRWGWVIQGHHLGASFTVAGEHIGFTPLFIGASPLTVDRGDDVGWSAVSNEIAYAEELVRSLTAEQFAAALSREEVPGDVVNGVGRKRNLTAAEGLRFDALDAAQQSALRRLVEEYVRNAAPGAAAEQLAAIEAAGWDALRLSWRGAAGGADQRFYYRVQGPRILIELTHQPQHIHSIVRDPVNDYGERWLGLRYLEATSAADLFAASRAAAAE